ncbi:TRAP type protein, immunogenic protein [Alkalihalophilus pseudofirmus OF4]|jgi:TRAP transporter TAXI family solute receptor|uniref:TRAP type protein, immunogenic protein n=3 Tax=Alkalihalophilus TaxID=2893060 RepID=D3FVM5_ALKPO|nr:MULTISPECIES: TAXI family TRAP transporter solute-binding subunit [Alkalihalophilus]ADC48540.1 TRAP type protein, immunogenic protein [Alkalihalophilus pseudofirmus OF4]ERN52733.1 TRAP transporter [Alkalihalophilus marmarensis DSM 21297]MCM3488043.1 TAXI family TRAP transporter solute-binding subunit [Alkalihalophilus marmarensis]MDV2885719.1 TAXI family TRAP transporter solute-binding subunit [Alkalihalophilus pseudofirmus]MED1600964.1 TAXI family TRAP transporter solute-binding subunit [A
MKKKFAFLSAALLSVGMLLGACGGSDNAGGDEDFKTDLQMGTGSTGGTYYPLGQEMANVMNDNVDFEDFNVSAVASGASVENLGGIYQGTMQLGMTVHIPALEALNGEADFEGAAVENFGFMGHIYPEVMQVVTTENTGITSIADLEGKRVAIGPAGSGTQAAAKLILSAYGLEDGDYQAFEEGFGDAAARLQDGQLDASFGLLGLPASNIEELAFQRDVVLLPVEGEALQTILDNSDYGHLEIPADTYEFLDGPVDAITAYAILVGSTNQISEDLGYEIVKGLYENVDSISHPQGVHLDPENILNGSDGLPFHPGAEKYFKEQGIIN